MQRWWLPFLIILLAASRGAQAQEQEAALDVSSPATHELWDAASKVLVAHCISCHSEQAQEGGLSLATRASLLRGSDEGPVVDLDAPQKSRILEAVIPVNGVAEMPLEKEVLSVEEIEALRRWLMDGAVWPEGEALREGPVIDTDWWSWKPLDLPKVPDVSQEAEGWSQRPIDRFILRRLEEQQLGPSDEASRPQQIRRVYFDLIGLPPTADEIQEFVRDTDPRAFEKLVDRLLASPRYGERWGRHWLDVVHYGDTHGYDKDKPRPNAWPYRDYVIRSLNQDRPVAEFARQQLAGDVLATDDPESVLGTGFIAAGPWDFIGQVEVPETKIDGQIARHLDRDDMVRTTLESFCSVTVGCARCHNHKFDPISQEDYYRLQAVFAAVDRADRPYDLDPEVVQQRQAIEEQLRDWRERSERVQKLINEKFGSSVEEIQSQIDELLSPADRAKPEFGFHSQIAQSPDQEKWVQLDLGDEKAISKLRIVGCHDSFADIGAGFGFPVRFRIEASNDPEFKQDVHVIVDRTEVDVLNPGVVPLDFAFDSMRARFVRMTATRLAYRQNDYIFALAELQVWNEQNQCVSEGSTVTSLDSIEAPVRWSRKNLVDNYWFGSWLSPDQQAKVIQLESDRVRRWEEVARSPLSVEMDKLDQERQILETKKAELPPQSMVYAGTTQFSPQGNFKATDGIPRKINVLIRGNVLSPGEEVSPGGIESLGDFESAFEGVQLQSEGDARLALANWITNPKNPLFWRSMANRAWVYHFGRGLVDSPNDFGRMGQLPSHPELLDWLAYELRKSGGSQKHLHRIICSTAAYQQASANRLDGLNIDASNQWYWRMNRRRLEAEAIRDATLAASGKLDLKMYGPGFQDFVVEKPEHSPHYEYHLFDPANPGSHRRAVYRFIVRSQQQPFMTTLDCADPSMQVDKRNETITPQQSLALMNNMFMLQMANDFALDLRQSTKDPRSQIQQLYLRALGRAATPEELAAIEPYLQQHGLENVCRLVFNLNEFLFVD
jgi:mono/diheme cytochrome c family protein